MVVKRLSNEFLGRVSWMMPYGKNYRGVFSGLSKQLEKYRDKVNWEEVSGNVEILWTPIMLDKFKQNILNLMERYFRV